MSEKPIEKKYMEWAGLYVASTSEYSLDSSCARTAFFEGYLLAKKEDEEKIEKLKSIVKQLDSYYFESENACMFCDMGEAGYSTKGISSHDDYCVALLARQVLKEI